ncbi:ABC transporter substrate-binding protein [soil metagenome]
MSVRVSRRALLAFSLAAIACKKKSETDPMATPKRTRRVVSLSPSTTETVCALGARAQLVGRSRFCDYPLDVVGLPDVGGYVDPNLEAIIALKPDLVVGARGPAGAAIATDLEARGIATFIPRTETLAEVDAMIRGIGKELEREAEAEAAVSAIASSNASVERALSTTPSRSVLLLFGVVPVVAAGPNSFGAEVLAKAHGTNVVKEGGTYPVLDLEVVVRLDPDVIIDAAVAEEHGSQRIAKDAPGWRNARAVRENRVLAMPDERVLRPGPRIGEGIELMARALYPAMVL